jgi:RHS repeat-associated protein
LATIRVRAFLVCVWIGCLAVISLGQVAKGTPKFGSFGGGPLDTINLGNGNVHFDVPILSKGGRGIPFTYALSYDASLWTATTVSGVQQWTPATNYGWRGQTEVATGYISYTTFTTTCFDPDLGHITSMHWRWTGYHDTFGVNHQFRMVLTSDGACSGIESASGTAIDGSGYTINAADGTAYIKTPSGAIINAPLNVGTGAGSIQDANGNKITVNGSGQFFDTLSSTTAVLTVAGAGTSTSPTTFTYTSPAGGNAVYTAKYTNKTLRTYFRCTGTPVVADYPATPNVPLITEIDLPDYNATSNPTSKYTIAYEDAGDPSNPGAVTGRISSITLPTGGAITYAYSGGTNGINCADGSTATLTHHVDGADWIYTRTGSGNSWTTTVQNPNSDVTTLTFQKDSATTDPTGNFYETSRIVQDGANTLESVYTCYNGNLSGAPTGCSGIAVATPILRQTVYSCLPDCSGKERETNSVYDTFGLINEVDDYDYGTVGAGVGSVLRKTITTYAALGNGIVDRPSSVIIKDGTNAIIANTTYTYDEGTPTGTISTPQHATVSGSRGNVTTVAAQANGSVTLYRKFTYYDTGTLQTSTEASTSSTTPGLSTTYTVTSCGNSFVTSIAEPLSLSRSMAWNCTGGVLTSVTDENSKVSSTLYTGTNPCTGNGPDAAFWRPFASTDPSGNSTCLYYISPTRSESKLSFNSGSSVQDVVTTVDAYGRTRLTQARQGPSASNYDTIQTDYDVAGCGVSRTTLPFVATLGGTSSSAPGSSTTHDALCRVTNTSDGGGGSTSFTYTYNDTYQSLGPAPTGENTKDKQLEYDGLGRLASVCEITSSGNGGGACGQASGKTGYWTKYTYDALGNRLTVSQNAQATVQTRSYVYDMLGRMTSETNPETANSATTYVYDKLTSDASCGTVTFAGDMVKRTDAAGSVTCSAYDALHRVTALTYAGTYSTVTDNKTFVYDATLASGFTLLNTKGRLAQAYTCPHSGSCSPKKTDLVFSYSARGEIAETYQSTPHSGTPYYHLTAAYWEHGRLKTLSGLPSLPTLNYGGAGAGLDGEGRYTQITVPSGGANNPVTAATYGDGSTRPLGVIGTITFGSGDNDSYGYDLNTGRMNNYTFNMGTTPTTDVGALTWNTNGSLQQLAVTDHINTSNSHTCTYKYDDLSRISAATCPSNLWQQTFSYDAFGNIKKTVPTGSTGMNFQPTYDIATNRITSTPPYAYDGSAGNLSADVAHSYSWDAAGKMVKVDSGLAAGVCLIYDAMGRMVEQGKGSTCDTAPTSSIEIVYSPTGGKLGLMNGQTLTKAFVPLLAGAQAVYNASGLQYYRHADWLGSSRLATTPSRTSYSDIAYAPFGEPYAATGTQDLSFTEQNQDTEASVVPGGSGGLYDFLFREQAPVQGRWLSPDPAGLGVGNPTDPQSWNRYSYVSNRPMASVDQLGLYTNGCLFYDPRYCPDPGPPGADCFWNISIFCDFPHPGPPWGGGGGGGGGGTFPNRHGGGAGRIGGKWPNGETLGLPTGLNLHPASLLDLLGLSPGSQCDFGGCGSLGFQGPAIPVEIEIGVEVWQGITALFLLSREIWNNTHSVPQPPNAPGYEVCRYSTEQTLPGLKLCAYTCDTSPGMIIEWPLGQACPKQQIRPRK